MLTSMFLTATVPTFSKCLLNNCTKLLNAAAITELYISIIAMEPEVKAFLLLIIQSLSMAMLWMMVNMTAGIYFNLAFFEDKLSIWNILYYIFFLGTLVLLIIYFRKKWKGFKEIGE